MTDYARGWADAVAAALLCVFDAVCDGCERELDMDRVRDRIRTLTPPAEDAPAPTGSDEPRVTAESMDTSYRAPEPTDLLRDAQPAPPKLPAPTEREEP